jgi:hypothetical protein
MLQDSETWDSSVSSGPSTGRRFLDIGCATGALWNNAKGMGSEGVEICEPAADTAGPSARANPVRHMEDAAFPEASFTSSSQNCWTRRGPACWRRVGGPARRFWQYRTLPIQRATGGLFRPVGVAIADHCALFSAGLLRISKRGLEP